MSSGVAQVKKRFVEFETYLRKDTEGLRRLKLLKDDVNVLRTSLAAAQSERDAAVSSMEAARQRANKAEMLEAKSSDETRRLRDQVVSLRSQVESLTTRETENDVDSVISGDNEYAKASLVVKRLRKMLPTCPSANGSQSAHRTVSLPVYVYREDIAKGWSYTDIWLIGAATAVLSAIGGSVIVVAKNSLKDIKVPEGIENDDRDTGLGIKCLKWFRTRIDWRLPPQVVKESLKEALTKGRWSDAGTSDQTAEGLGL